MPCSSWISFVVSARSEQNYYLMFDSYAGAFPVMVDKIIPPDNINEIGGAHWCTLCTLSRSMGMVYTVCTAGLHAPQI